MSRVGFNITTSLFQTWRLPYRLLFKTLPLIEFPRKSEYFRRCEKRRVASGGFCYPLFTLRALCPGETFITEISFLRFSRRLEERLHESVLRIHWEIVRKIRRYHYAKINNTLKEKERELLIDLVWWSIFYISVLFDFSYPGWERYNFGKLRAE